MMLGFAWQSGLVPVSDLALKQAIELNAVAIDKNIQAFELGRVLAHNPQAVIEETTPSPALGFEALVALNVTRLTDYHSARYAKRYQNTLTTFADHLAETDRESLGVTAAKALYKLMAIKDEYEVARLHMGQEFHDMLAEEFEEGFSIKYHMAPPLLSRKKDARGRPLKREFGAGFAKLLGGMAQMRRLRNTVLDPFRYTAERRQERDLISWYEGLLAALPAKITTETSTQCQTILAAPMEIRGYGPVKEAAIAKVLPQVAEQMTQLG
jgi:indolepyruvate ferredoxin oxidoreductase